MFQRLQGGKVVDTIEFCGDKKELKDPSTDPLAGKETSGEKQDIIFGVKATAWQFYTCHYYSDTIYFDVHFLPYIVIQNYIAGYYGIAPSAIENFTVNKKDNKITFSISATPTRIEKLQRNQYISVFMSQLTFINNNNPKHELSTGKQGKLLSVVFTANNNLSPNAYQDIFNQIPIGFVKPAPSITAKNTIFSAQSETDTNAKSQPSDNNYCVCSVKLDDKIKGFKNYPAKYYVRLPYYTTPHLVIHIIKDFSILIIFNQNKLRVQCELLPDNAMQNGKVQITEESIMHILTSFLKLEYEPFTHVYYNYKYQYSYKDPLQTFYKKMRDLKFLSPRKTHGFQYDVQGLLIENITELPLVNITYFQQQEIAQIDIYAVNSIDIINFNVLIFKNYFGFQEQDLDYSISGIKELQLVDPVQFGQDDRYDYERLVNDVRKRPFYQNIQFLQQPNKEQVLISIDEADKKYTSPSDNKKEGGDKANTRNVIGMAKYLGDAVGGAKGSSVYTQQYDQELIDAFARFQERLSRGFVIRNQTYGKDEIFTQYQCHNKFFINLSQTNGKIAISCTNEKINTDGIGIYGFYDIAKKILKGTENIRNIRKILMGRVSISAIKYTQWVLAGRCAELSVQLAQLFGSDNLMLALLYHSPQIYSTREQNQFEIIDEEWFTSVFGKSRDQLGDGEIIYSPELDKFYATNLAAKNPLVYIQFQYGQKYLLIKDDLATPDDVVEETTTKKKNGGGKVEKETTATQANRSTTTEVAMLRSNIKYYIPYRMSEVRLKSIKAVQQPQLPYINSKFMSDIKSYFYYIPIQQYFVVLRSTGWAVPYIGDLYGLNKVTELYTPKWPTYDDIKRLTHINNFETYYINYKKQIIGASQSGIYYYWQATTDVKININMSTIKLGSYPIISNNFYNKNIQKRYVAVDTKKIVCHLFAKYYYLHSTIPNSVTAKSVIKIAQSMHQLSKEPMMITNAIGDIVYYLSSFTMKQIDEGMELLLPSLPKQQGLQLDYILQNGRMSRYNNDYFLPADGEEIYHYRPQGL